MNVWPNNGNEGIEGHTYKSYTSVAHTCMTLWCFVCQAITVVILLALTAPNPAKSSKGHFLGNNSALLETGTFTSSNGGKITTWQEVQAVSAEYERSTKTHGAF